MFNNIVADFCIIFSDTVLFMFEFGVKLQNLHYQKCKLWQKLSCLSLTTLGIFTPNSLSIFSWHPSFILTEKSYCIPEKAKPISAAIWMTPRQNNWCESENESCTVLSAPFNSHQCHRLYIFRDQGLLAEKGQIWRLLESTLFFQDYVFPFNLTH